MVDLVELAKDENFDLYGISARCVNCSKNSRQNFKKTKKELTISQLIRR